MALGPLLWNCAGIARPIDGDGTISTSGASALAVTGSAVTLTRPAKKTDANMALVNRRGHNFSRENCMALVHPAPQPCSPTPLPDPALYIGLSRRSTTRYAVRKRCCAC